MARDISERKRTELDLQIAAIAFQSQDGVIVTDAHKAILRVNPAFSQIQATHPARSSARHRACCAPIGTRQISRRLVDID